MKTNFTLKLTFILLAISLGLSCRAEDMRKYVSLSGYWKFSIGDDLSWASPSYNDSDWDQIATSNKWEDQGYNDYNGYAWYRKTFRIDNIPNNTVLYLVLGRIDDVDEVYLNGKLLGKSGHMPPEYVSAYDRSRKYVIPAGYLLKDAENVIAVRVYDSYQEGGMVSGSTGIYFDADVELLDVNLNGRWKFHTGDDKEWREPGFKDDNWKRVHVPSYWENQGYDDYDGYAWYRVNFRLPKNLSQDDLYLVLGKIDDIDDVYLNGKYVGSVYDLRKDGEYRRWGGEYNARRIYHIKDGLLNRDGINTLAVRVYDEQQVGGIYQGPVGIMSEPNMKKYRNRHYESRSFWDFIFDEVFVDWE